MASTTQKNKLFYCDAAKGYTIKVLIDVLAGSLSRSSFRLEKNGIFIKDADPKKHMLFSINLERERFRSFRCAKEMIFSLNLRHLQKMVRNVKKKDSMILFIDKSNPGKLGISIRPESATSRSSSRIETMYITIQNDSDNTLENFSLPEVYRSEEGEDIKVYGHPMVIEAPDFQKIKKFSSIGKEITVRMQKSNFISFYCDSGEVYSDELSFGYIHDDDSEEDSSDESTNDSSNEDSESNEDSSEIPNLYQADFYMSSFSLLVKLPGLCSQMKFYAPKIDHFPLKIGMDAGRLGEINIFIKDIQQIAYEDSLPV